ncbi:MAG TPA: hydrogen peroxide-inducible genes activator [Gammaproteobacteria bacterium]|nr:hydrogen peroxide-inducible genes activator [Gammaproteobacteria bacterium]
MDAPRAAHFPTFKQLRYFVALVEQRHFGRAAAQCFVSQSAFSIAIQELESLLDANLVDRTNRRVTITAVGKEIAVLAKLCIQDLTTLVEVARGRSRPLTGPLQLGIIPTVAPFLLPRVLPLLRKRYPELKLFLHEDLTERLNEQLLDGTLDAVLLALPYDLRGAETMELFDDRFRLAARAGTKLVDPEHYRFSRLNAGSVLLLREGHCLRDHAIEACRIRETPKLSRMSASSLLTLIEMVDADLGVTFLPEMAVGSALLQGTQVKTYPLGDKSYRTVALAWRRGSVRAEEFRELGKFIADQRDG